ncbi:MAG TPA: protein kinase [Myxococcota bacterium]|jgi:tRNA A-37 threonylcarbamoyl transferase component Bud32|nr:protein kinase [Myxococcota bacterium]
MAVADGTDPLIGKSFGNYRLTRQLGEGGMGTVYLGEHPLIGKKVALKVLHSDLARDEDIVARFFTEARAVCRIGHEHIVDIIDFGKTPEWTYFVMEYLDGEALAATLQREGALPVARAVKIASQTASALSASHKLGIVHRDLKPENIFITKRGSDVDFVKVLDFGIAKLTGDAASSSSHKTRAGVLLGTPYYMSPEQCEGRREIDHRADVYSLGVIIYEMLTGEVPFGGDAIGQILAQHLTAKPSPPSKLKPGLPKALEAVVLRCLEKAPADRYANMDELATALDRAMATPTAGADGSAEAAGKSGAGRAIAGTPPPEVLKTLVDADADTADDPDDAPTNAGVDDDKPTHPATTAPGKSAVPAAAAAAAAAKAGPPNDDIHGLKTQMFVPEEELKGSARPAGMKATPAPVAPAAGGAGVGTSGAAGAGAAGDEAEGEQLKTRLYLDEPPPAAGSLGAASKEAAAAKSQNVAEMKTMMLGHAPDAAPAAPAAGPAADAAKDAGVGSGGGGDGDGDGEMDADSGSENIKTVMWQGAGSGPGSQKVPAVAATPPQGSNAGAAMAPGAMGTGPAPAYGGAAPDGAPVAAQGGGGGGAMIILVSVLVALLVSGTGAAYYLGYIPDFLGLGIGAGAYDEDDDEAEPPTKKRDDGEHGKKSDEDDSDKGHKADEGDKGDKTDKGDKGETSGAKEPGTSASSKDDHGDKGEPASAGSRTGESAPDKGSGEARTSAPDTSRPKASAEPDTAKPKATSEPATAKPKATSEPASAKPKATAAPASAKPKATAAPVSAKPKATSEPASAKPRSAATGTAKATAAPKSAKPKTKKDELLSPF